MAQTLAWTTTVPQQLHQLLAGIGTLVQPPPAPREAPCETNGAGGEAARAVATRGGDAATGSEPLVSSPLTPLPPLCLADLWRWNARRRWKAGIGALVDLDHSGGHQGGDAEVGTEVGAAEGAAEVVAEVGAGVGAAEVGHADPLASITSEEPAEEHSTLRGDGKVEDYSGSAAGSGALLALVLQSRRARHQVVALDLSAATSCSPLLVQLPASCPRLSELWLRGLPVSAPTLLALAGLRGLRLLALGGCDGLDDRALGAFLKALAAAPSVEHQIRLRQPSFADPLPCSFLSPSVSNGNAGREHAIAAAALTHLELRGLVSITDETLDAVSNSLGGLAELSLYGCRRVTDRGLVALSGSCPNLRWLNVSGAYKVTDTGMRCLLSAHPSVLIYNQPHLFGNTEHFAR